VPAARIKAEALTAETQSTQRKKEKKPPIRKSGDQEKEMQLIARGRLLIVFPDFLNS
jgi:hypothetical protein